MAAHTHALSEEDAADVRQMLALRSVRQLPLSVSGHGKISLAEILASFRGKKKRVTFGLRPQHHAANQRLGVATSSISFAPHHPRASTALPTNAAPRLQRAPGRVPQRRAACRSAG